MARTTFLLLACICLIIPSMAERPEVYVIALQKCEESSSDRCAKVHLLGQLDFLEGESESEHPGETEGEDFGNGNETPGHKEEFPISLEPEEVPLPSLENEHPSDVDETPEGPEGDDILIPERPDPVEIPAPSLENDYHDYSSEEHEYDYSDYYNDQNSYEVKTRTNRKVDGRMRTKVAEDAVKTLFDDPKILSQLENQWPKIISDIRNKFGYKTPTKMTSKSRNGKILKFKNADPDKVPFILRRILGV